jgi:hypothetical protein
MSGHEPAGHPDEECLFGLLDEWENLLRLLDHDPESLDHLDALIERREVLGRQVEALIAQLRGRWPGDHPRRLWLRGELERRRLRIREREQRLATLLGQDLSELRERLGGLDHTRRTLAGYGRRLRRSPRLLDTDS